MAREFDDSQARLILTARERCARAFVEESHGG